MKSNANAGNIPITDNTIAAIAVPRLYGLFNALIPAISPKILGITGKQNKPTKLNTNALLAAGLFCTGGGA